MNDGRSGEQRKKTKISLPFEIFFQISYKSPILQMVKKDVVKLTCLSTFEQKFDYPSFRPQITYLIFKSKGPCLAKISG